MNYLSIISAIVSVCENWPKLLFGRVMYKLGLNFLAPAIDTIQLRNGVRFSTGPRRALGFSDLFIISEIWKKEVYLIKDNPQFQIFPNDTVVDIGANKGYFSVFAAGKANFGGVFAFEPESANYNLLVKNLDLNLITNVRAEKLAVAAKSGEAILHLSENNEGGHSIYKTGDKTETVKTATLDEYCRGHGIDKINFLKIDCEGAEYEIIETLPDELLGRVEKISLEYHDIPGSNPAELVSFLSGKNFKILEFNQWYIKAVNLNF